MVWAILAAVGVPLWLCAAGISVFVLRNRSLRRRPGDVAVRMRRAPGRRWSRGHAVWVHDVFAFRGSPAAWKEELLAVRELRTSVADTDQPRGFKGLHGLGDHAVIARLRTEDDDTVEFAARREDAPKLVGPFRSDDAVLAARSGFPSVPTPPR